MPQYLVKWEGYKALDSMLSAVASATTTLYGVKTERFSVNKQAKEYFGVKAMPTHRGHIVERVDRLLLVSVLLSIIDSAVPPTRRRV